ncbi:MAG: DUF1599 domain-containing protein [Chitinophagales bacterium]|jgi:hypothetical protein|nr:DUF1599 domain-containing protein [Sphingobacteriales bacterium]
MENTTINSFKKIIANCQEVFLKKNQDYGMSWTIMRLSSLTDQIYIKAKRIRNIQESKRNVIGDSQQDEFHSIINYCIMAMIIATNKPEGLESMSFEALKARYTEIVNDTLDLLSRKNTDYGEVWRDMRVSSMTDIILAKLLRIKQIEDNQGETTISEGAYSNYQDILNYSIFCIIQLSEGSNLDS